MTDAAWKILLLLTVLAVIVEGLVLVGVLRELGSLILHVGPVRHGDVGEGPEHGTLVSIDTLTPDKPAILVFVSPNCDLCRPIADALPVVHRSYPDVQVLTLVVNGRAQERQEYARALGVPARIDLTHLYADWALPGTPFAVGVDPGGHVVASGIVNNLPQLESLAEGMERVGTLVVDDGTEDGRVPESSVANRLVVTSTRADSDG